MSSNNYTDVSIDNKNDFIAQVKATGVIVAGGSELLHTEGEGRSTRYFVGDEKVTKAEVVEEFEARMEGDNTTVVCRVPTEGHEHGDVQCRYCGKVLGYLTGSHMNTHGDNGPRTVDEYRAFVAKKDGIEPSEVPLCTDDMMNVFVASGDHDDEMRARLSEGNKARWEAGEYDHLRKEETGDGANGASA
jgi:hypothetical protein